MIRSSHRSRNSATCGPWCWPPTATGTKARRRCRRRRSLRLKDVPVFAVPVGSPRRLPDIELLSLDAPTFGIAGKSVRIPFTIESSLPRDYVTTVTLTTSDGDELTQGSPDRPDGPDVGRHLLEAEIDGRLHRHRPTFPRHADELIPENNQLTAPISIREEKLQVLVVESYPALGIPLSAERPVARSRRQRVVPAVPSGAGESRRRQSGLHQAVPRRAGRTVEVRCRLSGRRRRDRRTAHRGKLPAAERPRRTPGERAGVHAGYVRPAAVAARHRTGRFVADRAGRRRSRAAGDRARRAISN